MLSLLQTNREPQVVSVQRRVPLIRWALENSAVKVPCLLQGRQHQGRFVTNLSAYIKAA